MIKYLFSTFTKILLLFSFWRIVLIFVMLAAIKYLSLGYKDRFLGGGFINYSISPEIFSWANFDGEHYLSIAIVGYKGLEQAFFPIFPMLISFFAKPFSQDALSTVISSTIAGLLISNIAFLFSIYFLWKLLRIDFSSKIVWLTIILLLVFPTSFYLGSLYNESLYLLLSVLSFYFGRSGNWFWAATFGVISSATRIFGVLLLPALLIEAYQQRAKFSKFFWIFLIPLGLILYMYYQYILVGDPLAFYRLQKIVGEQHQSGFIFLPQVYFRYLKMLITVDVANPIYQTVVLEFFVGILFFILPIIGYFKKVRISYLLYALIGFLSPTIQGSFSSVPRYILAFFPSFLVGALILDKLPKLFKILIILISFILLCFETALFIRGYWVA